MRAAAWYSRADMTAESSSGAGSPLGLSARLLVLTIGFVMLSEVLIYAPSIARFRTVYLEEHIAEAHLATLALDENYGVTPTRMLEREFLARVGAYGIVLRHPERKVLMLSDDMPPMAEVAFDLRDDSWLTMLLDAFAALGQTENRVMRVMGVAPHASGVLVEVVMDEAPMVEEMYAYSGRILSLSIVISLLTAVLVYFSLQWLMVRPMTRIIDSITAFRQDPEEAGPVIAPSGRGDEIGIAERELEAMQQALRASLRQKTRLATLGAAVAKINHDLRNSLATAVLVSDRLADIDDPEVKRVTPRLYEAIDRAVRLCGQTLSFVSDSGADVATTPVRLRALVDDVGEAVRAAARPELTWENLVAEDLEAEVDREQLFRALINLGTNAAEAKASRVEIQARIEGPFLHLDMVDNGPGLAPKAREKLFQPFASSARKGGTGLGLVIARDIIKSHGGDLVLLHTGDDGTTFSLLLPVVPRVRQAA